MPVDAADTDLRRQAGPHAFVVDLDSPILADEDHHHLAKALRLRAGDALTLSDAAGRWRTAVFGVDGSVGSPGPIHEVGAPSRPVTLAFALTKGAKPETVVQKATELGVDRVVIFHGERSVPRWDLAKRAKSKSRFERIAREAAMQSRRVRLPSVEIFDRLADFCGQEPAGSRPSTARADFGGGAVRAEVHTIIIGPEGGWGPVERELVPEVVDLGPTVLRSETAAIVAASALVSHRLE